MTEDDPLVVQLSTRQLAAYNRCDLDAFCACYHPDIEVLDARGVVVRRGMAEFRAGYGEMFARHRDVHAEVDARLVASPHVVERERWSRVNLATGARTEGTVLVRYTELEGLLRWAEFLPLAPSPSAALARESG